jgi:hypothetical protein
LTPGVFVPFSIGLIKLILVVEKNWTKEQIVDVVSSKKRERKIKRATWILLMISES